MVLVQLTGDTRWLGERYQCLRAIGLDENGSGGLDPAVRAEVIDAAREAVLRWGQGALQPSAQLPQELLG